MAAVSTFRRSRALARPTPHSMPATASKLRSGSITGGRINPGISFLTFGTGSPGQPHRTRPRPRPVPRIFSRPRASFSAASTRRPRSTRRRAIRRRPRPSSGRDTSSPTSWSGAISASAPTRPRFSSVSASPTSGRPDRRRVHTIDEPHRHAENILFFQRVPQCRDDEVVDLVVEFFEFLRALEQPLLGVGPRIAVVGGVPIVGTLVVRLWRRHRRTVRR